MCLLWLWHSTALPQSLYIRRRINVKHIVITHEKKWQCFERYCKILGKNKKASLSTAWCSLVLKNFRHHFGLRRILGKDWRAQHIMEPWNRDWQTLSAKGQIDNILGFMGHIISEATSQLHCCVTKAAIDNTYMTESSSVPIRLYSWTMQFAFHVIFMCHKIFFLWFFSPTFEIYKNNSYLSGWTETGGGMDLACGP